MIDGCKHSLFDTGIPTRYLPGHQFKKNNSHVLET